MTTNLSENNRTWLFWTAGITLTIVMGIGGVTVGMLQKQIDNNTSNIWQIQSTAVTEDKLDRQLTQMKEYIDVRMQSIESSQREMARQLTIFVSDMKDAQEQNQESLQTIYKELSEKQDRE